MRSFLIRLLAPKVHNKCPGLWSPQKKRSYSKDYSSISLPAKFITNKGETVTINIGQIEDYEECCALGRKVFREKPISLLFSNFTLENMEFLNLWTVSCLNSKLSLVARNSSGSVVGLRMSKLSMIESPTESATEVFGSDAMGRVLEKLNEGIDIFKLYKTERVFRFVYLGVHPDYRQQGLAEKMFDISIGLAKMKRAGVIAVEGVNKYATKAAIASGFEVINTVFISDFKDIIPPKNYLELEQNNPEACLLVRTLSL